MCELVLLFTVDTWNVSLRYRRLAPWRHVGVRGEGRPSGAAGEGRSVVTEGSYCQVEMPLL